MGRHKARAAKLTHSWQRLCSPYSTLLFRCVSPLPSGRIRHGMEYPSRIVHHGQCLLGRRLESNEPERQSEVAPSLKWTASP